MVRVPFRRPLASPTQSLAIVSLGIALLLVGVFELAAISRGPFGLVFGSTAVMSLGLVYAPLGTFAWLRRPGNLIGPLIVWAACTYYLAGAIYTGIAPLIVVGFLTEALPVAAVLHLLHAFPSGRLRGLSRPIVLAGYATALYAPLPDYLFTPTRLRSTSCSSPTGPL